MTSRCCRQQCCTTLSRTLTLRTRNSRFGSGSVVADIVAEVTDDKNLPKQVRKQLQIERAPHKDGRGVARKTCDKTCNLRDIATAPPADWSLERRREYFGMAKQVVDRLPKGTRSYLMRSTRPTRCVRDTAARCSSVNDRASACRKLSRADIGGARRVRTSRLFVVQAAVRFSNAASMERVQPARTDPAHHAP